MNKEIKPLVDDDLFRSKSIELGHAQAEEHFWVWYSLNGGQYKDVIEVMRISGKKVYSIKTLESWASRFEWKKRKDLVGQVYVEKVKEKALSVEDKLLDVMEEAIDMYTGVLLNFMCRMDKGDYEAGFRDADISVEKLVVLYNIVGELKGNKVTNEAVVEQGLEEVVETEQEEETVADVLGEGGVEYA